MLGGVAENCVVRGGVGEKVMLRWDPCRTCMSVAAPGGVVAVNGTAGITRAAHPSPQPSQKSVSLEERALLQEQMTAARDALLLASQVAQGFFLANGGAAQCWAS